MARYDIECDHMLSMLDAPHAPSFIVMSCHFVLPDDVKQAPGRAGAASKDSTELHNTDTSYVDEEAAVVNV